MSYIKPENVVSPKATWRLIDVVLDKGEGEPAYAIGMWDRHRRIGFRWNGDNNSPLGNPQSRGLPTWVILDPALNGAVLKLVEADNPAKVSIMRAFLGRPIVTEPLKPRTEAEMHYAIRGLSPVRGSYGPER